MPPLVHPLHEQHVLIAHPVKLGFFFFVFFSSLEEQSELWPPAFTACIPLTFPFRRFCWNTPGDSQNLQLRKDERLVLPVSRQSFYYWQKCSCLTPPGGQNSTCLQPTINVYNPDPGLLLEQGVNGAFNPRFSLSLLFLRDIVLHLQGI